MTSASFGQVLATDNFTYSDGPLVGNGSWANISGTEDTFLVSNGEAVVTHGTPSEDVQLKFADDLTTGTVMANFDIKVTGSAPIPGTDNEYFVNFSNDGSFNFRSRIDIIPSNSGTSDYTLGLSASSSTNDTSLSTDFTYGSVVSIELSYNIDTGVASLTVGAETITSSGSTGETIDSFNLRQSDSNINETIYVDNLSISYTGTLSLKNNTIEDFSIYPNPASQDFITISSKSNAKMDIQVFDIIGKQVINTAISNNTLNISKLTSGVYVVRAIQDGATSTRKLVVK